MVLALVLCGLLASGGASAGEVMREAIAVIRSLDGSSAVLGEVILRDGPYGMLVIPSLTGLTPGPHATHVHEKPSCGPAEVDGKVVKGGAAGGHFDPHETGRYEGPYGDGALGDLPNLIVEADGRARIPVLAPRLRVEQVAGRSLMIHAGADRYGPTFPTSGAIGEETAPHAHLMMKGGGMASVEGAADDPAGSDDGDLRPDEADMVAGIRKGMPMDPPPVSTGMEMGTNMSMGAAPTGREGGGMRMYCGLIGPASTGISATQPREGAREAAP